jgi:hypothetical protein
VFSFSFKKLIGAAEVIECLSNMHEVLSSNPDATKKKKKKKKRKKLVNPSDTEIERQGTRIGKKFLIFGIF